MNIKQHAFKLRQQGLSYSEIASELGIGRTTAYNYVKELELIGQNDFPTVVPNSSEQGSDQRSEQFISHLDKEHSDIPQRSGSGRETSRIKEFTGDQLVRKKFDCLDFKGKFLELIGKPSRVFSAIIWGLPKGGKSNLSLRFADYLQEYFGKAVYIAAEEGESVTLQEKFKAIGGSKLTVVECRDREEIRNYLFESEASFIFIDSINTAGIDNDYLELLKEDNPHKSFIAIVQATKGGNFKGDQALTHNCDFIIKVVDGVAYHTGRFNEASEIKIFDVPLYEKNAKAWSPELPNRLLDLVKNPGESESPLPAIPIPQDSSKPVILPRSFNSVAPMSELEYQQAMAQLKGYGLVLAFLGLRELCLWFSNKSKNTARKT